MRLALSLSPSPFLSPDLGSLHELNISSASKQSSFRFVLLFVGYSNGKCCWSHKNAFLSPEKQLPMHVMSQESEKLNANGIERRHLCILQHLQFNVLLFNVHDFIIMNAFANGIFAAVSACHLKDLFEWKIHSTIPKRTVFYGIIITNECIARTDRLKYRYPFRIDAYKRHFHPKRTNWLRRFDSMSFYCFSEQLRDEAS